MRPFFDLRSQQVDLGRCLGRGGEGAVYSLPLRPRSVAKIYTQNPDDETIVKLGTMVELGTPPLVSVAAWPEGLLLDRRGGRVVGFLMPRVDGHHPIHCLYGPRDRVAVFPEATWAFLIRAARNLAAAFDTVHEHNHVLGDVNQGNVVVSANATVRLIDCDSFQITHDGRAYPCRVGVPLFTPPELQGRRLDQLTRTADHDRFGLAALVFHLLFMGRHPCGGRHPGRPMNVEAALREGIFAFGREAARQGWQLPPFSLKLAEVPSSLANLFERAFGREAVAGKPRPTAAEWVTTLDVLERNAVTCSEDPRHVHGSAEGLCPWCRIEKLGGPSFFLLPPGGAPGVFDLAAFCRALEAVRSPGPAMLPRPRPVPGLAGVPLPAEVQASRHWPLRMMADGRRLMAQSFVKLELALGDHRFPGSSALRRRRLRRQQQAETVRADEQHLREVEVRWERECSDAAFSNKRRKLAELKAGLVALPALDQVEQGQLAERLGEAAPLRHLCDFALASSGIPGLGATQLETLAAHGMTTVADVSPAALFAIPAIDLDLVRTLLLHRELVERSLARPATWLPGKDRRALQDYQLKRRKRIEEELRTGLDELMALRRNTFARRVELSRDLEEARTRLADAKAGRRVVPLPSVPPAPRPSPRPSQVPPRHPAPGQRQPSTSPPSFPWPISVGLMMALQSMARTCPPSHSQLGSPPASVRVHSTGPNLAAQSKADRIAAANPNDAKVQFNVGVFNRNAGRHEQAIAAFQRALAADPSLVEAHYYLGTLMVNQNKVPEAVRYLETYLSLSPPNALNVATARTLLPALRPYLEDKKRQ